MKIIKLPALKEKVSMGRSQIYQRMKDGDFPQSILQGKRGRGWIEEEVDRWIESRIAARADARETDDAVKNIMKKLRARRGVKKAAQEAKATARDAG